MAMYGLSYEGGLAALSPYDSTVSFCPQGTVPELWAPERSEWGE